MSITSVIVLAIIIVLSVAAIFLAEEPLDSIAEISQMYGIGQSDVKVTLMRMRRSLQKILEEEELM